MTTAVDPHCQRHRVARAMAEALIADARLLGVPRLVAAEMWSTRTPSP